MDKKIALRLKTISLLDGYWTSFYQYMGIFEDVLFNDGNRPIQDNLRECVLCLRLMILEAIANIDDYDEYHGDEDKHIDDSDMLRTLSVVMSHVRSADGLQNYITQLEPVKKRINEYCVSNIVRFIELAEKFDKKCQLQEGMDLDDNDTSILYTCVAITFFELSRRKMELKLLEQENGT